MPKNGKTNLTQRERLLLGALANGATYAEAARHAGYSAKHLRQSGFQAFQILKMKMPELLEKKGLSDDATIDKYLRPALEAKETVFAKYEGKITDKRDVVAWGPRLSALDILFRLKGSYAEDNKQRGIGDSLPFAQLTDGFIRAINTALGMHGTLVPLNGAVLPEDSNGNGHGEIDLDVLPQD
ncbi:MAG: hypothetical protein WBE13_07215 [Candidatus Acidiferrum sp.]